MYKDLKNDFRYDIREWIRAYAMSIFPKIRFKDKKRLDFLAISVILYENDFANYSQINIIFTALLYVWQN